MPGFSIILPVRNGGEYVKECVRSILMQTHEDFNVLVLDNNSTDDTVSWIESMEDNRFIIYPSPTSLTIEENWARIKDLPKNEFMTMIGHDDVFHPAYLEIMNELIGNHPDASLYQTHFDYINAEGNEVRDCLPMDEMQQAHEFLTTQMRRAIDSTGTGYLMRSADYDELGGMPVNYPNLIFADFQLWVSLMRKSYKATSSKFGFSYRLHDSLSRTTNGMGYQVAFTNYINYLITCRKQDAAIAAAIDKDGKEFLLYYCESIAHRLLKTPMSLRSVTAGDFVEKCESLAKEFIPGQSFEPLQKFRIRIAKKLDQSGLGRRAFALAKKFIK